MEELAQEKLEYLKSLQDKDSVLSDILSELIEAWEAGVNGAEELLHLLHQTQRIAKIYESGNENNDELVQKLLATSDPLWKDHGDLPVDKKLQIKLAETLYNSSSPQSNENVTVAVGAGAKLIAETLVDRLEADGINFDFEISDPEFSMLLINGSSEESLEKLAAWVEKSEANVNKLIIATSASDPEIVKQIDKDKRKTLMKGSDALNQKTSTGEVFYTLTRIPTSYDSEIDNIPYDEYLDLFFELCDQPWDEIQKAQEKLIEKFDAANEIHITNDDGTDIKINITGQTFANSVIAKNIPGSEIFSSPLKDGVNGTLVAHGRFRYGGSAIIENITLKFEDGKVVDFSAEKGEEDLKKILDTDEGSRFTGEIGIGTNPHLKQHVINGLLVEKIGGSFHLALGRCYSYDEYCGKPVNLKNGNESEIHWDLTTMLHEKNGKMHIDGELIQDNGQWIGEEYKVLNEGWSAIPKEEQPPYWQQKLAV